MSQLNDSKDSFLAMTQSVFVFLVLVAMLAALVLFYDFSKTNLGILSFILALTAIVLVAKTIYHVANEDGQSQSRSEKRSLSILSDSSQKLFSEVYSNSLVAYLILDKDGFIISSNTSAARLLGRSAIRLNGNSFFSCIDTNKTEHLVLLKEKFRNGVTIANEEIEINHANSIVWATMSIFQFRGDKGEKVSLVTLLDITKQKEVDVAKSEFVSLASHQLRTPIAGMRWSAELLLMDGADSLTKQQRRYISRLLSNIQRMGNLIDDFLQVSRFDLGTRTIQPEVVNLQTLIEDIVGEQVIVSNSKKLKIHKKFDDSLKEIVSDQNLLRMIITNIYSNALKYSRLDGEVEISYRREGDDLIFDIRDTGMGIPIVEQSRIFTKIFRASNAAKEVPDGTGLGLYIVKKAVQVLKGRVTFVSTEDVGTTFTIVIPIVI